MPSLTGCQTDARQTVQPENQLLNSGFARTPGSSAQGASGADLLNKTHSHDSPPQGAQGSTDTTSAFRWADRIERNQELIDALHSHILHKTHSADGCGMVPVNMQVDNAESAHDDLSADQQSSGQGGSHSQRQDSDSNSTTHTAQSATASSPTSATDTNSKASRASHSTQKAKKAAKKSKDKEGKQDLVNFYPRKKKTEEHRSKESMAISLEQLKPLFKYPLKQAASKLGICTTAFKSVCRKFGLRCWPYKLLKQAGSNNECIAIMLRDGAGEDG